jgi:hypothetical protein
MAAKGRYYNVCNWSSHGVASSARGGFTPGVARTVCCSIDVADCSNTPDRSNTTDRCSYKHAVRITAAVKRPRELQATPTAAM